MAGVFQNIDPPTPHRLARVGNGIDSEWFPLFRGRKFSFRGIPSSAEEPIPKLGTKRNGREFREKMKFYGTCTASLVTLTASTFYSDYFSLPRNGSEHNSESLLLFLFHGTEFRVVFSSAEKFGRKFRELASSLVPRNGILSCFLFR
jgi:hypothetical protein